MKIVSFAPLSKQNPGFLYSFIMKKRITKILSLHGKKILALKQGEHYLIVTEFINDNL